MLEPRSTTTEAAGGTTPEPLLPQSVGLGLTEELARRVFRELPRGGDNSFALFQGFGLDKAGSSPEATLAVAAVIRLAGDKIAGLINTDDNIPPENKPATVRVNLKHLFQLGSDETAQQRFAKILEFVLGDNK